jgi:hypothetical protein
MKMNSLTNILLKEISMKNNIHIHTHTFRWQKFFFIGILCITLCGVAIWFFQFQEQIQSDPITSSSESLFSQNSTFQVSHDVQEILTHSTSTLPVTTKPQFKKPNTEWTARTITLSDGRVLTYRFGEGNPEGANPLTEEEKELYKKCYYNTTVHDMDCPPVDGIGFRNGYITPDIERLFLELINHPNWEKVLTNCEQQFRQYEDISSTSDTSLHGFVTYDTMLNGKALDPENLIWIDGTTGRKQLHLVLQGWLRSAMLAGIKNDGSVNLETINNCITQNGGIELYRAMDLLNQKSYYPD